MEKNNYAVHISHCCKWHGCKYGDINCPVDSGEVKQKYLCEECEYELDHEDYYKQVVKNIKEIKKFLKEK